MEDTSPQKRAGEEIAPPAKKAQTAAAKPPAAPALPLKKSIREVDLQSKVVTIRVDFNVVSAVTGMVEDEGRILGAVPTIKLALEKGAKKVVLLSHCGRPNGQKVDKDSLLPVVAPLERLLGQTVTFVPATVGPEALSAIAEAPEGAVLLMENLRFHIEETGKGIDAEGTKKVASEEDVAKFRAELNSLGDVFVNDAFGTAHRAHSSMVGINHGVAGLLLKKELDYFAKVLDTPVSPYIAIMGGAKVGDKIPVMQSLISKGVTDVIVGGGMAFTFLKKMNGTEIGASLYDEEGAGAVPAIMALAKEHDVKIHIPTDFRCGDKFSADAECVVKTAAEGVPAGWMGLDIGPETEAAYDAILRKAKLIIWNGPMGVFEFPKFAHGSEHLLKTLVSVTESGCITVVGGGDSAALCSKFNQGGKMSHVSTGGGATLELLEGKTLPGVAALEDA